MEVLDLLAQGFATSLSPLNIMIVLIGVTAASSSARCRGSGR
jgi:TctA family transporter